MDDDGFHVQENIRNTAIKDIMRDQCIPDLVESWLQIIVRPEGGQIFYTDLCTYV